MELRDFAEQVLFAQTLEEKLRAPDAITDERPGVSIVAPAAPARPPGLSFKPIGTGRGEFPGAHRLEKNEERGRLLHFFANHELLATELMALVLLRFPEAPAAFRRGVLQTLKDEQKHTRLYIERMRECGTEFGALPVSGYFWRSVSPMANPTDYVASLSLTFEQANLDFARHFAKCFDTVGDVATAQLLEKIYRDEIGHVAYGLKWFRRWKNPSESDWAAFCQCLKFPLSPSRAKGLTLNVEGRRAAGFDDEFIAELKIHSQSRGRTPTVFFFNPFAEGRIAQGNAFNPVKHQAQLALDLSNLPQFLARQEDIVLIPKRPATDFLSGLKQAGFALPEFVELRNGKLDLSGNLASRKLGELRPWAWGPDSVGVLEPLFANVTGARKECAEYFGPQNHELYSKAWSAALLRKLFRILDANAELRALVCDENEVGVAARSFSEVEQIVRMSRARGHHKVVIKEAIGLAGHNAIRLWEPEILDTQRRWIESAVGSGREVVVEPWLERVLDFSVQLEMTERGLKVCGYTGLLNDLRGQYLGNWAEPSYARQLPAGVATLFKRTGGVRQLAEIFRATFDLLQSELAAGNYLGPIGIDAFVFRKADGNYCLKPIVEINPRYTMGRVTVELMKQTAPGTHGVFKLISRSMVSSEGFNGFVEYAAAKRREFPIRLEGEPVAKIAEGFVCLTDPKAARVCLATFEASRSTRAPRVPIGALADRSIECIVLPRETSARTQDFGPKPRT